MSSSSASDVAIKIEDVAKAYTIHHNATRATTAAEALVSRLKSPLNRPETETFWALKGVTTTINKGDVVGVIGRNGAGKSTLLKVLSRITEPTRGRITIHGRVGSLLEVGTGFHPELTGRENVYLNGSILGMSKAEIDRHFDAIVEFSGTEKFLDTPTKRYSSGMTVRLAFAVAAHLDTEVLVVDEVLAVGDAEFQKKCLGKMQNVAQSGRTVLYVSHMMASIQQLCNRCLYLVQGQVKADGPTNEVLPIYIRSGGSGTAEREWSPGDAPGNEVCRLRGARIIGPDGTATGDVNVADAWDIEVDFEVLKDNPRLNVALHLYNDYNVCVFVAGNLANPALNRRTYAPGFYRSRCTVPGHLLNNGQYRVTLQILENIDSGSLPVNEKDALTVEVHDDLSGRGDFTGDFISVLRPDLNWTMESLPGGIK